MQDTNIHTGVYEQIINRLFKLKLNKVDTERFYIGKKPISKDDAMSILSKYLQNLIEIAFANTPDDQDADKYTDFINSVIIIAKTKCAFFQNEMCIFCVFFRVFQLVLNGLLNCF